VKEEEEVQQAWVDERDDELAHAMLHLRNEEN
jgi:uncharacterized protein YecT (DUF1311 family)